MAQYTAEVNPAIAYQWFSVDENGNETEIEGATGKTLSLENLTTGKYYCRLTYSNATTAGVSMKSDVVTATITECEHSGGEATCTEKAKCEICGAEYGEMLPHSYANIKSSEYLKSAATCTERLYITPHAQTADCQARVQIMKQHSSTETLSVISTALGYQTVTELTQEFVLTIASTQKPRSATVVRQPVRLRQYVRTAALNTAK